MITKMFIVKSQSTAKIWVFLMKFDLKMGIFTKNKTTI
jgi:hypothetical protein